MATFDYTNRDYLSIRQDLINRAAITIPEWNGNDSSEFANMFVDLWAYMGDVLHFYIDRAASETFLETATQRESVLAIANLLDYIPGSIRASRGTVRLQLNAFPPLSTSYVVPQFTTFTGIDGNNNSYSFYLENDLSALTTLGAQASGNIIQGVVVDSETVGTSTGAANQQFSLLKQNVDVDSITVLVYEGPLSGGVSTAITYKYVPQISTATYLDKVFTTRVTSDGYTQLIFGNGFNGQIPTTNTAIVATYRTTDGAVGNLPINSIKYITSSVSSYVSIVSSSATSGGADSESITSIKNNVARLYRAQDRAVSLQDYKDLILQIQGVSKATATYATNVVTLYPVPHQTDYPPAPTTDTGVTKVILPIDAPMKEAIEAYFSTRSMLGVTASVVNPVDFGGFAQYVECTPVYVAITVHVKDNYVQSWVKSDVDKAIKELLTFENVFFGKTLTIGEVYRAALSVTGVDYVDLVNLSTTYAGTGGTTANITANAVKLLCFTDDISNNLAVLITPIGGLTGSN